MSGDAGADLRALYGSCGGVRAVFSSKVADYLASRPDYPAALFDALADIGALRPRSEVADLGSGTGLLSSDLLRRGHTVHAVEPNPEMRRAADRLLSSASGYRSICGSAEATTLPAGSIDLVTAAQAFHWFDIDAARSDCRRILRPQGQVALIWNDRVAGDALHRALDELFARFGGAKRDALLAHEDRSQVPRFFGRVQIRTLELPHEHRLDAQGLEALVLSRSYMPARDSDAGEQVRREVAGVFAASTMNGVDVIVRYRTVAMVARPAG